MNRGPGQVVTGVCFAKLCCYHSQFSQKVNPQRGMVQNVITRALFLIAEIQMSKLRRETTLSGWAGVAGSEWAGLSGRSCPIVRVTWNFTGACWGQPKRCMGSTEVESFQDGCCAISFSHDLVLLVRCFYYYCCLCTSCLSRKSVAWNPALLEAQAEQQLSDANVELDYTAVALLLADSLNFAVWSLSPALIVYWLPTQLPNRPSFSAPSFCKRWCLGKWCCACYISPRVWFSMLGIVEKAKIYLKLSLSLGMMFHGDWVLTNQSNVGTSHSISIASLCAKWRYTRNYTHVTCVFFLPPLLSLFIKVEEP